MRYSLNLLALAALATASPTTQPVDFAAILAAAAPTLVGPPALATGQTGVYNAAAASSSAAAAVTGVASANATQSIAARNVLDKRTFCFFGLCWGPTTTPPAAAKTTSICNTPTTPAAVTTPTKTTAVVTSSAVITSAPVITAPSTCTPVSWTNTNAFTTATSCSAPYEVGTYCGFINPEDPCAVQPDGYGTQVQPDTVAAFEAFPEFHKDAQSAITPSGYASTFTDLDASVNANSYLGLYTLKSYDVAQCASYCDNTSLCTGINIYIERDPSINPSGCSCTNPASITNYKCTLWGSGVDKAAATNTGQTRDGFQVVIAGSNGYEKTNTTTPVTPPGWTNPQGCGGVAHSHPSTCMGQKFFPGPFDASLCATYAASQNAQNSKSIGLSSWASFFGYSPLKCNFFNAFMVKQNGVAKGTYCSLFTQQYQPSAASYIPSFSAGFSWSIESSWSFCSK
ncbi:hypothetical protein CORC01_07196 [Colletotrichum orchidophilum]|uniref:Apple domain-containing protein n=1 Tax=Colletotrichum orchidophilum TaxID=1209926 RepID=A0A1G4B833_9PEZI|nr:uncharacterized protein CORC01_07196 [Colletotrichum orchidophilum]OHE97581.1 hypothetical protein CORC01_07196 [Colletotrichum orchidophilum]